MKKALIIGISGQDGSLLADYLLKKGGYEIFGTSRNPEIGKFNNLNQLGILQKVKILPLDTNNLINTIDVIDEVRPREIYNLSGQSSVSVSFEKPLETISSIIGTTCNLLEAVRRINDKIRFFNASSSDCFGETDFPATENTSLNPISPYAVSKVAALNISKIYRNIYKLYISSGILSNHESSFRDDNFIAKKIIDAVINISKGNQSTLEIGNMDIYRDWGWAPDYVEAYYLSLQQEYPDDYIIATGKSISLEEFINYSFSKYQLNYKNYIVVNEKFMRENELKKTILNPEKAMKKLNWKAKNDVYSVIDKLFDQSNSLQKKK